ADLRQKVQPLGHAEQRRARGVRPDSDDQARKQPRRALDEIEMTVRRRIEAARVEREIDAFAHGFFGLGAGPLAAGLEPLPLFVFAGGASSSGSSAASASLSSSGTSRSAASIG